MEIKIKELPPKALGQMTADGFTKPKGCYANASQIVLSQKAVGANYVLCWMKDSAGGIHGHAIFECQGFYFDPTLQANSGISTYYEHVKTYTRDQLVTLLTETFGQDFVESGYVPPALLPNGQISCVEVEN